MRRLYQSGVTQPDVSTIGNELGKSGQIHYTGKLRVYLEKARTAGVITMSGEANTTKARLVPSLLTRAPVTSQPPQARPIGAPSSSGVSAAPIPPAIKALLSVIAQLSGNPKGSARLSILTPHLKRHKDGDFKKAGYSRLKSLVDAAVERGLVSLTYAAGSHTVRIL
jgi:hypothetical protein